MQIRKALYGAALAAACAVSPAAGAVEFAVAEGDLPFPAVSVSVAGSFNEWKPDALVLERTETGFRGSVELADGTHSYKIVVTDARNGQKWTTDPSNPTYAADGYGGVNNVLVVKDGERAKATDGFEHFEWRDDAAASVAVAGEFNVWNSESARMRRDEHGVWRCAVKAERPLLYKFVVDGKSWVVEPASDTVQVVTDLSGATNNLRSNEKIAASIPEGWEAAPASADGGQPQVQ